jgi:hypothetical protein
MSISSTMRPIILLASFLCLLQLEKVSAGPLPLARPNAWEPYSEHDGATAMQSVKAAADMGWGGIEMAVVSLLVEMVSFLCQIYTANTTSNPLHYILNLTHEAHGVEDV